MFNTSTSRVADGTSVIRARFVNEATFVTNLADEDETY